MSSFGDIKKKVYEILDAISTVDGYNYEWTTKKRLDTYIKSSKTLVTSTIHYPEDSPIAEEILEESTNEYRLISRNIEIKSKVQSKATTIKTVDLVDQNDEVIDNMLDDLYCAFNSSTLGSCDLGVIEVNFVSANKEDITSKSGYYPFLLNAEFQIVYKKERC